MVAVLLVSTPLVLASNISVEHAHCISTTAGVIVYFVLARTEDALFSLIMIAVDRTEFGLLYTYALPGVSIKASADFCAVFMHFVDWSVSWGAGNLYTLPNSMVGNLSSLQHLDFSHTAFSGTLPAALALPELMYLNMSNTSLSGFLPTGAHTDLGQCKEA